MGKILFSGEFSYVCEGMLTKDSTDRSGVKVAVKTIKGELKSRSCAFIP